MTENPILLAAGADTQGQGSMRVNEPERFAGKTAAEPVVDTKEERHYISTMPHASMFRKDGTRIGFMFGHFVTTMKADIDYLDAEIAAGHPIVRKATNEEVKAAMMKKDLKGTLKKEIAAEFTADKEKELREKILRELAGGSSDVAGLAASALTSIGQAANSLPGEKLSGVEALRQKIQSGSGTLTPVSSADIKNAAAG